MRDSQKEIARMLIAGSAYVRQIGQKYGQDGARDYVNQTARAVCQKVLHVNYLVKSATITLSDLER
jgi:hypothetical protein